MAVSVSCKALRERTCMCTSSAATSGSGAESSSHAKAPDQVWLSDITYLWTREGWLYVCAVLDLYTRRIVGWAIAEHMTRQMVLDALQMAYRVRKPGQGLIFHSDRGSQRQCRGALLAG